MSGINIPLRVQYVMTWGAPPGAEVGAACDRLDAYFAGGPIGTGSFMIVAAFRCVDLFIAATTAAERQLRDTQLVFDMRASEARSNEQHVIARMANVIAKLQSENERLREAYQWLSNRQRKRQRCIELTVTCAAMAASAVAIAWSF